MDMIALTLASAIGDQFPDRFEGAADSPAANLRSTLTLLLAEHAYLASMTTDAALAGRAAEYEAANTALDDNSQALAAALGSIYDDTVNETFLSLWRSHIGFFVDYTMGITTEDQNMQGQAIADLTAYARDFGAFLASANPNLPQEVVAQALVPHINLFRAMIIAQAAGNAQSAYMNLRTSYAHMQIIADILSDAIITQFPDQFRAELGDDLDHGAMITVTRMLTGTEMITATELITGAEVITAAEMAARTAVTIAHTVKTAPAISSAPMLRSTLALLLGEHVLLTTSATEATLRGRTAEFEAAATELDGNSVELAATIGSVYGSDVEAAFLTLWREHIGFFFDYTTGLATGDQALADQALADLDQYADDFDAFLAAANPNLPVATVADLLRTHATTLISVIDAQATATIHASGDQQVAYPALQAAYGHMDIHAAALAASIAAQFPEQFPGDANSAAASLRATLNLQLAEHTFLVAKSAAAALDARNIEFEAAAGALDQNSQNIAAAIGLVYGDEAGAAFLPLWRKHIGFFIDYTLALIADDNVAREKAIGELTTYAGELAAFLAAANPNLPSAAVTDLVTIHAATTLAVIDAADSGDPAAFYHALRAAYRHMAMIANPLSNAIIVQFPAQFGVEMDVKTAEISATDTRMMTNTMIMTGTQMMTGTAAMANIPGVSIPVLINMFSFMPNRIEVPVGATVVWTNQDGTTHTVTSGTPDSPTDRFDSGAFRQGEQFSFTFTEAGEFEYFCQRHNNMRGTVVVIPVQ